MSIPVTVTLIVCLVILFVTKLKIDIALLKALGPETCWPNVVSRFNERPFLKWLYQFGYHWRAVWRKFVLSVAFPEDDLPREIKELKETIQFLDQERVKLLSQIKILKQSETQLQGRTVLDENYLRAQRMETIGTLAGGVAHDLSTIISSILITIPLLRSETDQESKQRLLDTIQMTANHGNNVLKQLLVFSRGNAGGSKSLINIASLIQEIGKLISETFPKSIIIDVKLEPDLSDIQGDTTQLHQVLLNLCVNARDSMPEGGRLTISAENIQINKGSRIASAGLDSGSYVKLTVRDTGCGIPQEHQARIFDPFFTTKEIGKGTGLGLSVAHSIVKGHNGQIDFSSELGKGSEFRVYLPAVSKPKDPLGTPERQTFMRSPQTVLLVDDDCHFQYVTKTFLEKSGYKVLTASDGTEAIDRFVAERGNVDVVLTDIFMPRLDGWQTIQALRKLDPKIPVVAISGNINYLKSEFGGDVLFIQKPFGPEVLISALEEKTHH